MRITESQRRSLQARHNVSGWGHGLCVGFAQNLHRLIFSESALSHDASSLLSGALLSRHQQDQNPGPGQSSWLQPLRLIWRRITGPILV
jgi:hypothetical protein